MSSLFDRCTPSRSYCTGSDTPHLSAVVGVWDLLGAPKSDGGCGEVENRCRSPRGLESSVLSLTPLGIYTCFRPHHTLRRTLVHLKDPTPLRQRTGVVYRIPCSSCEKVYIGQTGRTLDHRLKEHRRALISGNVQQSAVAEHATNEMHDIDWEKAEVVDCHPHYRQRCVLEAWHIRTEPHKMNTTSGLPFPNPPSAPALLRTCCCLHTIQHFFFLIFPLIILYTYHALHSPTLIQCMHAYVLSHITFRRHHHHPRQK